MRSPPENGFPGSVWIRRKTAQLNVRAASETITSRRPM